jgi:hypothetical protein
MVPPPVRLDIGMRRGSQTDIRGKRPVFPIVPGPVWAGGSGKEASGPGSRKIRYLILTIPPGLQVLQGGLKQNADPTFG